MLWCVLCSLCGLCHMQLLYFRILGPYDPKGHFCVIKDEHFSFFQAEMFAFLCQ